MQLTEQQKKDIKNCLQEISNSLTRVEAERDHIKDIINRMAEEFEMNKRLSRKLARVYHKRNIAEEVAAANELSETYDNIVQPTEEVG
jgi:archaellum component FlaC